MSPASPLWRPARDFLPELHCCLPVVESFSFCPRLQWKRPSTDATSRGKVSMLLVVTSAWLRFEEMPPATSTIMAGGAATQPENEWERNAAPDGGGRRR